MRHYWSLCSEACLGSFRLMKRVRGASLIGDLTLSSLSQLPTVILAPFEGCARSIDWSFPHTNLPRILSPIQCEEEPPRRRSAAVCRTFQETLRTTQDSLGVCVCVCAEARRRANITPLVWSNCLLLSLVTNTTCVVGISAFSLHCRASTTPLVAFSLPRAAGPMPHKYKHNLSYTSWLQDRVPHISARGAQPICIHIKVTPQKKKAERERGGGGGWGEWRRGGGAGVGKERAGICKQGFHLICKKRHCSGINLHLSSGKREQNPFDSKWAGDDCQMHRGTLCYPTENSGDWSAWHVTLWRELQDCNSACKVQS